jgi:hypothetical protein
VSVTLVHLRTIHRIRPLELACHLDERGCHCYTYNRSDVFKPITHNPTNTFLHTIRVKKG